MVAVLQALRCVGIAAPVFGGGVVLLHETEGACRVEDS